MLNQTCINPLLGIGHHNADRAQKPSADIAFPVSWSLKVAIPETSL